MHSLTRDNWELSSHDWKNQGKTVFSHLQEGILDHLVVWNLHQSHPWIHSSWNNMVKVWDILPLEILHSIEQRDQQHQHQLIWRVQFFPHILLHCLQMFNHLLNWFLLPATIIFSKDQFTKRPLYSILMKLLPKYHSSKKGCKHMMNNSTSSPKTKQFRAS